MPTVITKKSTVAAKAPLSTDLQVGELAVNTADKILYTKHSDNSVIKVGFDPTIPGPIGGTTPSTIAATAVTVSGAISSPISIQFGDGSAVALAAGKAWYDPTTGSWNLGMGGGSITQQIGEEILVYGKASSAISGNSLLQAIYRTGAVGASGVITFAPTTSGITDGNRIIGVATEDIALNGFGRITSSGVVRGINTTGSTYGETWADDDIIWYNPVTGGLTKVKPIAPNLKISIGSIITASSGAGSIQVKISPSSELGSTDKNVQLTSITNKDLLQFDSMAGYWKNVPGDFLDVADIGVTVQANLGFTPYNATNPAGYTSNTGTVTSVSVVNTNGFSGSVANATTTPAITITTTVTGLLKGNGTAISAATADTDYVTPTGTVALTNKSIVQTINAQTGTTYTFVLSDASDLVTLSNASPITATVPPNSSVAFPIGTQIDIAQVGTGQVTVAAGSGVTVSATPGLKCRAQYSGATLTKIAINTWLLFGDLAA